MPKPKYFKTPADFRRWLEAHHASADELWVGFHKKASGKLSLTWPESVDEALCFGWIDGLRKSVNDASYMIRFTPRRPNSTWSAVNTRRARVLIRDGRMQTAGLRAFRRREAAKTGLYAFENRPTELPASYLRRLKANPQAWAYYRAQPPGYRRTVSWWILSAKKEETRLRRLEQLIEDSGRNRPVPPLRRGPREPS